MFGKWMPNWTPQLKTHLIIGKLGFNMRINFYYTSDHSPVVCQDDYYIDMYGDIYLYDECAVGCTSLYKIVDGSISWELV